MKKISMIVGILFLTSCASVDEKKIINYMNTNPIKVEQATNGLDVVSLLPSRTQINNGTIAVRTIEGDIDHNLDSDVFYMIEDNIIANLVSNDYRVLERDPQAMHNLFREGSSNYKREKVSSSNKKSLLETIDLNDLKMDITVEDGGSSSDCCGAPDSVWDYLIDDHKTSSSSESFEEVDMEWNSADYILSYRVLECGVNYTPYEESKSSSSSSFSSTMRSSNLSNITGSKLKRSARTKLHLRLTDAKTSEIVAAGMVENEIEDIVKSSEVEALKDMGYEYYHHTLPLNQDSSKDKPATSTSNPASSAASSTTASKGTSSSDGMMSLVKDYFWAPILLLVLSD